MGVYTLYFNRKHAKKHTTLAWFLTNAARVIAYFGWMIGHYENKEKMAQYTLIAAVVLFVVSTVSQYLRNTGPSKMESAKKVK